MRRIANSILSIKFLGSIFLLILVLFFLQSKFAWARIAFGSFFASSEPRFHRFATRTARVGSQTFQEDILAIENRGSKLAAELYIFVTVPAGRITRYDFVCQEPFTVTQEFLPSGRIGIWLERLTPGATATLYVWSVSEVESPLSVELSATVGNGSVKPTTVLTAREEIESYVGYIHWMGRNVFHFLQSLRLLEKLQEMP